MDWSMGLAITGEFFDISIYKKGIFYSRQNTLNKILYKYGIEFHICIKEGTMPVKRSSEAYLEYLSNHFPCVVVTGARQTGKTTLVKEFSKSLKNVQYVTIEENNVLYPIEIKKSANPGSDALKNFTVLSSLDKKIGKGAVICLSPFLIPIDANTMLVPVSAI